MAIPTSQQLRGELNDDLSKAGSLPFAEVVNDSARKTFTTSQAGAVFEFAHKQPDREYWNGSKYYISGRRSRVRIRRTQIESV